MGRWGEGFGRRCEKWGEETGRRGEEYGRIWGRWGEDFGRRCAAGPPVICRKFGRRGNEAGPSQWSPLPTQTHDMVTMKNDAPMGAMAKTHSVGTSVETSDEDDDAAVSVEDGPTARFDRAVYVRDVAQLDFDARGPPPPYEP